MVFQGPSLLPTLDVIENVALPLVLAGMSDREARGHPRHARARSSCTSWNGSCPKSSRADRCSALRSRARLAPRPKLLLADEPTGQLDHETAAHVVEVLLQAAHETGAALIVSTHDPAVADRLDESWPVRDGGLTVPRRLVGDSTWSA